MKYSGFYCRLKLTDDLLSYRVNKLLVPFVKLRKFNPQVELPLNIIVGYESKRYIGFVKGLVLYIQSSTNKHKIRKLYPINITFLPKALREKLLERLENQAEAVHL